MGTPEEIYQTPATVFAAGFIGTPNMNFLTLDASGAELSDSSISLPTPFSVRPGPVTVGIRPGAVRFSGNEGAIRGRVERNEFHGETRLLTLSVGTHELCASVPAGLRVREGELLGFDVTSEDLHLFDPTSGKRLA